MRLRLVLWACLLLLPTWPAGAAVDRIDGNRFALVIGNARYLDGPLTFPEPVNDARNVAEELRRDGFDVEVGENLTGDAIHQALARLSSRIKPGADVLVFFSGLGLQSNRFNYLIPVDATIRLEDDIAREGIGIDALLGEFERRGAGVRIVLLDAARRNPFEARFRGNSAGLAPLTAPANSLVMSSTAAGTVIPAASGDHGLFADELIKGLGQPGAAAADALGQVAVAVTRASGGGQTPALSAPRAVNFSFSLQSQAPPRVAPAPPAIADAKPDLPSPPAASERPSPAVQATAPKEPLAIASSPASDAKALTSDAVISDLNRRIAANPSDQSAWYRRGQIYAMNGAYHLAIKDFDEAIRLNPRDVEAYNNRCWTRTVMGDLGAAAKDCEAALRLRPGFVDALDSRGLLNLKSGQARKAIADFDAALAVNPRLASSLYGRGLAKVRDGTVAEGQQDISSAKAIDPGVVDAFAGYGLR